MQQNVWAMRHPECGPMGGNHSSRSQVPIQQALGPPVP
jgi:hypothetical protein